MSKLVSDKSSLGGYIRQFESAVVTALRVGILLFCDTSISINLNYVMALVLLIITDLHNKQRSRNSN